MQDAKRIVVVGMSGAGKSSLARQIAARTQVPHVELDRLFWLPEWEPRRRADFREAVAAALAAPAWVADGNYSSVRDIVWARAQRLVWLDLPFHIVFARVLARTLRRAASRELLWDTNRESLRRAFFTRESILWWVIRNHARRRREFAQARASGQYAHLDWVHLKRPRDVAEFVKALP